MSIAGALLFIAILAAASFTWGMRWKRRAPSLAKIMELRAAIAVAYPPHFIGQFTPEQFHTLLEEQLRTYLEFGGDLTPPKPARPTSSGSAIAAGPRPVFER